MIEGKVAAVLNDREIAINRGRADGVTRGMKFAVLDPSGKDVRDPETGDVIGSVMRTKVRVQIVDVQPRLSVGRTYEKTSGSGGLFGGPSVADLFAYQPPRPKTLSIEDAIFKPLGEDESVVKRGDPVRELSSEPA